MELSYMNQCFYGFYNVLGSYYMSTMRRMENGNVFIELISGSESNPMASQTEPTEGQNVISIMNQRPLVHQSVLLKRQP